jgi:thiamine pyrophosphokinase
MGICYVVGAGEFYGGFTPNIDDLVIAADGGYDTLCRLGIRCDLLIGDMDSLGIRAAQVESLTFPVEKDETDMHLAYLEGVRRGYTEFRLYGGVGGREDHTFANYSLLLMGKLAGHSLTLVSRDSDVTVIKNETVTITGEVGDGVSVFAFGGAARGVTLRGLKYTAEDITLTPEFALGVSNELAADKCTVCVADGALLIMHRRDIK